MFQGDIAQFAPADLLLFLSHMNKEGVLTVRQGDQSLSLSFRRNLIVDAGCEAAEELVLELLAQHEAANEDSLDYLRRAREETGLPLGRILEDVEWISVDGADKAMAAGLRETVFRLLLLESGEFHFTEIAVDDNPRLAPMDTQALVMDLTREVDEYRELLRSLGSLDRLAYATSEPEEASVEERYVLTHAGEAASVGALLETAPFPRLTAAWAVSTALDRGWLEVKTAPSTGGGEAGADGSPDTSGAFGAYRLALRRLLQAPDQKIHIRELLNFAQTHCTQSILFAVSGEHLKRATVYRRDPSGRLTAADHRDPAVDLASDMVFQQAIAAGRPFVGAAFPSPVIEALEAETGAADCALLPLGRMGGYDLLLYAVTAEPSGAGGPLACLELLSWQIRTPVLDVTGDSTGDCDEPAAEGERLDSDGDAADRLVASIKDLPPMPNVVARILSLLADSDCDMNQVTEALSHDPALVARLIKVSNSSLYGGYQETGSVNQAIVRLGTRTTRSVVVAASTRSLFPSDNTKQGLLGRALWEHAVRSGLAARRVAEFTRRADSDEAFAAGVLHDIGKVIILLNESEKYAEAHKRLEAGAADSVYVERELLGFDHCLVGDRLLESWGMPGNLRAVARWHHEPTGAGEQTALVQVVACGDLLSHSLGGGSGGGGRLDERLDRACEALDLDEGARGDLIELLTLDMEQSDLLD